MKLAHILAHFSKSSDNPVQKLNHPTLYSNTTLCKKNKKQKHSDTYPHECSDYLTGVIEEILLSNEIANTKGRLRVGKK